MVLVCQNAQLETLTPLGGCFLSLASSGIFSIVFNRSVCSNLWPLSVVFVSNPRPIRFDRFDGKFGNHRFKWVQREIVIIGTNLNERGLWEREWAASIIRKSIGIGQWV